MHTVARASTTLAHQSVMKHMNRHYSCGRTSDIAPMLDEGLCALKQRQGHKEWLGVSSCLELCRHILRTSEAPLECKLSFQIINCKGDRLGLNSSE